MVSLQNVRDSNRSAATSLQEQHQTAVFVGATSGIGLATLRAFTSFAKVSTIYVIGRSLQGFSAQLGNLQALNSNAEIEFIEAEISLIKEVDRACEVIKAKSSTIDKLWLSPGLMKLGGRYETTEGLHIPLALAYFSRLRFAYNLLPLLNKSTDARVVSILAGGLEKEIDVDDIEVKWDFGAVKAAQIPTTLTTLAFNELAKANPTISFIHQYPGFVNSGALSKFLSSTPGILSIPFTIINYTLVPLVNALLSMTLAEAGERGVYLLTSSTFNHIVSNGIREGNRTEEQTAAGEGENTLFLLNAKDELVAKNQVVRKYIENGTGALVLGETKVVWERCLNN